MQAHAQEWSVLLIQAVWAVVRALLLKYLPEPWVVTTDSKPQWADRELLQSCLERLQQHFWTGWFLLCLVKHLLHPYIDLLQWQHHQLPSRVKTINPVYRHCQRSPGQARAKLFLNEKYWWSLLVLSPKEVTFVMISRERNAEVSPVKQQ